MPIIIHRDLPANKVLSNENIFVMNKQRALHQDIRPLKIAILNLMPTKVETETQLLRLIGNTPLQVDITLVHTSSHVSKNISPEHLGNFYRNFDDIKNERFDGMVITGAPVEKLDFEDVDYWNELEKIMRFTTTNVTSTLHICWGAQAGLYYHYNISKFDLDKKMFGVFSHNVCDLNQTNDFNSLNQSADRPKILRGFDDEFYAPHSRYTEVLRDDINAIDGLNVIAESDQAGVYMAMEDSGKRLFVMGHCEYDANTLANEYFRDSKAGLNTSIPANYFVNDNPKNNPVVRWRGHGNLLFSNWLNYYVYQETPYSF